MFLKKIEIFGFKSFAEKCEFIFDKGITSIVGPNGSGKSNLADAVRWVLGEQSAKILRGSKMEDIIFSGSEKRKPLGYAQVTLLIDNSDGVLPVDFSEVEISRKMYRSGESEYYLNKTLCRLKDINEIFLDTGIGKEGYSIIGQGKIDEILSTKSEDRRGIFEEAAGIAKYKARKLEAIRKLDSTDNDLTRIDDIINELEIQLGPLGEQRLVAEKYSRLMERLKTLEVNIYLKTYYRIQKKIGELAERLNGLGGDLSQKKQELDKVNMEYDTYKETLSNTQDNISKLQQSLYDVMTALERKKGKVDITKERKNHLSAERERLNKEIEDINENLSRDEFEYKQLTEKAKGLGSEIKSKADIIKELEHQLDVLDKDIARYEETMSQRKNRVIEILNLMAENKVKINSYSVMLDNIASRLGQLDDSLQKANQERNSLVQSLEKDKRELNKWMANHQALIRERDEKKEYLEEKIQGLDELNNKIKEKDGQIKEQSARLRFLLELEKNYEGFSKAIKNILRDTKVNNNLSRKICGVVAQLIDVAAGYERAVETALGFALQNIVTETEEDAKYVIEYLKNKGYGRATFLPISSIRPRGLGTNTERIKSFPGFVGIASNLVKCHAKYRNIMENLLGSVVVVDNLDSGIRMARAFNHSFKIVTVDGDMINPGGSMTGGAYNKEQGLINRKAEIRSLKGSVEALTDELNNLVETQSIYNNDIDDIKATLSRIDKDIHDSDLRIQACETGIQNIRDNLQKLDHTIEQYKAEYDHLTCDKAELQRLISSLEDEQKSLSSEEASYRNTIQSDEDGYLKLTALREEKNRLLMDAKISFSSLQKEEQGYIQQISKIEKIRAQAKTNIQTKLQQINRCDEQYGQLEGELKDLQNDIMVLEGEKERQTKKIDALNKQKLEQYNKLKDLEIIVTTLSKQYEQLRERRHRVSMDLNRCEVEQENIINNLWEHYGMSINKAKQLEDENINITDAKKEVEVLKAEINDLGPVNMNAIEEYQRVENRLNYMKEQRRDLVNAKNNLKDVIRDITSTMEKQFKEQFEQINKNFSETFEALFNGGQAQLLLTDPNNVLESGIDIVVQPPGKRLQNISLLSGGEKALTAIAILFAILKLRPTPFCILDEIDAALDDTNVENFARYLTQYSHSTQFIMITHRRGTMEVSNTLYGVAMEEKGVSKMVSVKLEEKVS
ncbi:MAG TPA: chromosome segregation protein SMC [Clostridiales bacterium]|nr:chromosome segregation protein SMC [Clostridiales bacterium]